jgi:hypothetical protein
VYRRRVFDYFDLTGIDQGARPELSPALLAEVRALGFSELGWVAAVHRRPEPEPKGEDEDEDEAPAARPALPLVSYVMLHQDGVTTLALTKTAEGIDSLGLGTLFDDGLIVKTETTPPGLRWQIISRNIRLAPRHGYDFAGIQTSDPKALVAFHQERVRAAGATSASRAPVPGSTLAHIAMRVRFREVMDPLREARTKWSLRLRTPVFLATTAIVFGVLVVLGARGPFLVLGALVAIACGVTCGLAALPFLLTVLVPTFLRDVSAPPRTSAAVMIASALRVLEALRARVPGIARSIAVRAGALPVTPPRKRCFLLANASVMPALGFALMGKLGSVGPVAAMGIMMTLDAAFMFVTKQTRVDALRRWFFPALATPATLHRRATMGMRWGFGFAGAFLLLCARGWMASGAELAPWVVFGWACVSVLIGYYAWEAGADGRA